MSWPRFSLSEGFWMEMVLAGVLAALGGYVAEPFIVVSPTTSPT